MLSRLRGSKTFCSREHHDLYKSEYERVAIELLARQPEAKTRGPKVTVLLAADPDEAGFVPVPLSACEGTAGHLPVDTDWILISQIAGVKWAGPECTAGWRLAEALEWQWFLPRERGQDGGRAIIIPSPFADSAALPMLDVRALPLGWNEGCLVTEAMEQSPLAMAFPVPQSELGPVCRPAPIEFPDCRLAAERPRVPEARLCVVPFEPRKPEEPAAPQGVDMASPLGGRMEPSTGFSAVHQTVGSTLPQSTLCGITPALVAFLPTHSTPPGDATGFPLPPAALPRFDSLGATTTLDRRQSDPFESCRMADLVPPTRSEPSAAVLPLYRPAASPEDFVNERAPAGLRLAASGACPILPGPGLTVIPDRLPCGLPSGALTHEVTPTSGAGLLTLPRFPLTVPQSCLTDGDLLDTPDPLPCLTRPISLAAPNHEDGVIHRLHPTIDVLPSPAFGILTADQIGIEAGALEASTAHCLPAAATALEVNGSILPPVHAQSQATLELTATILASIDPPPAAGFAASVKPDPAQLTMQTLATPSFPAFSPSLPAPWAPHRAGTGVAAPCDASPAIPLKPAAMVTAAACASHGLRLRVSWEWPTDQAVAAAGFFCGDTRLSRHPFGVKPPACEALPEPKAPALTPNELHPLDCRQIRLVRNGLFIPQLRVPPLRPRVIPGETPTGSPTRDNTVISISELRAAGAARR